jgi:hypothetical protein
MRRSLALESYGAHHFYVGCLENKNEGAASTQAKILYHRYVRPTRYLERGSPRPLPFLRLLGRL